MQSARMVTLPFILFELFSLELCPSQKRCPRADCLNEMNRISVRNCMQCFSLKLYLMFYAFDIKRGETSVFS